MINSSDTERDFIDVHLISRNAGLNQVLTRTSTLINGALVSRALRR